MRLFSDCVGDCRHDVGMQAQRHRLPAHPLRISAWDRSPTVKRLPRVGCGGARPARFRFLNDGNALPDLAWGAKTPPCAVPGRLTPLDGNGAHRSVSVLDSREASCHAACQPRIRQERTRDRRLHCARSALRRVAYVLVRSSQLFAHASSRVVRVLHGDRTSLALKIVISNSTNSVNVPCQHRCRCYGACLARIAEPTFGVGLMPSSLSQLAGADPLQCKPERDGPSSMMRAAELPVHGDSRISSRERLAAC